MVLRKSFYIHWSAGRSPRVHEVNPGRDPSCVIVVFLKKVKRTIGRETRIRREASGIER